MRKFLKPSTFGIGAFGFLGAFMVHVYNQWATEQSKLRLAGNLAINSMHIFCLVTINNLDDLIINASLVGECMDKNLKGFRTPIPQLLLFSSVYIYDLLPNSSMF